MTALQAVVSDHSVRGASVAHAEARAAKMHGACNPHYLSRWHNIFHSRQVISINIHAGAQDLA